MKRLIPILLAAAIFAPARGQLLEASAGGALDRAEAYASISLPQASLNALAEMNPLEIVNFPASEAATSEWLNAESLFGLARYTDAADAFRRFMSANPDSPLYLAATLRLAECLMGLGDFAGADGIYFDIDARGLSPEGRSRCAYGRGLCLLQRDQPARAKAYFAEVEGRLKPLARYYLGAIAYGEADYAAARAYFAETDPAAEPGRRRDVYLSMMDLIDGNYERALAGARRGLRLEGLNNSERAMLEHTAGEALWRRGLRGEALKHLRQHMQLAAEPAPAVCYLLGVDAYERGAHREAADLLSKASEAPGILGQSASLELGLALYAMGSRDAAVMAFERALGAEPSDPEARRQAYYNYAVAKFAGANVPFGSTTETFENFLAEYPDGPYSDRVREYLAQGYTADEDYDKALARLEAIRNPNDNVSRATRHLLYLMGVRELNAGNAGAAAEYFARAASMPGDRGLSAEIQLWQARALAASGDHRGAAEKYGAYLRDSGAPNRPEANYGLGYALFAQEKYPQADAAFAAAESSQHFTGKELADILNRRADIAYYDSQFAEAAVLYRRAYDANRANGDYAAFQSARMTGFQRRYAEELTQLEDFERRFPASSLMPDVLLEKAAAQISLGQTDAALASYDALTERYPLTSQGRSAYIQKAMALLEAGHRPEATEAYKEVIRRYPSSGEASQASGLLRAILAAQGRGDEYLAFMSSVDGAPAVERSQAASLLFGSARRALENNGDAAPMEAFLANYPDAPEAEEALALLAEADYRADRTEEALARWQTLAGRASTASMAVRARMGILRAARDLDNTELAGEAAQAILESSAATDAALNEATYSRALLLSQNPSQVGEAIELWKSIADDTDDLYGAKSAYAAAEALFAQGRRSEALAAAEALSSSRTPHKYWIAKAFILQSDILAAEGKRYEAREYLRALLENYPGDEPDIRIAAQERLDNLN